MPSRESVCMNRVEVNCVPLSVVSVKFASRLPAGKRFNTACSTAAKASSVRQRRDKSQPPAHICAGPHLGHVRLPDLIRCSGFHTTPFFLPPCPQTTRTNQQAAFPHHAQNAFSIYVQMFFPLHPPRDAAITVGSFLTARGNDL